ncbi:MAG: hypothetical protein HN849_17425 [Victivallales bacterium]|jgi:hypothetical protein|nr:hypothetical protein [Victivallales bacterium]MBT7301307.1 hypothetical protein [Victivallales bacterium]
MRSSPTMACVFAALLAAGGESLKPDREGFLKRYALADGQNMKFVPPPFHPYRLPFSRERTVELPGPRPAEADATWYRWDAERGLSVSGHGFGQISVRTVLNCLLGVQSFEMEGSRAILETQVQGDFVVRAGVPPAKLLPELAAIFRTQLKIPVRLAYQKVRRPVYVAKGTFQHKPINKPPWDRRIELYVLKLNDDPAEGDHWSGGLEGLMDAIGTYIDAFVMADTTGPPPKPPLSWRCNGKRAGAAGAAWVLSHVTEQTGLTFVQEERTVSVLVALPLRPEGTGQ